eukprot:2669911-Pyramimonas_sp.AAC.1
MPVPAGPNLQERVNSMARLLEEFYLQHDDTRTSHGKGVAPFGGHLEEPHGATSGGSEDECSP